MGMKKVALLAQPGDVFLGQAMIDEADFDPSRHLDAAEYGGDCDNEAGKYCWHRAHKRFEPMQDASTQRASDFMRMVELGIKFSAAHIRDNDAAGADAAEYLAIARRHFPQQVAGILPGV